MGLVEGFTAKSANFGLLGVWAVYTIYTTKFAPDAASVTDRALLEGVLNMGVDSEGGAINKVKQKEEKKKNRNGPSHGVTMEDPKRLNTHARGAC